MKTTHILVKRAFYLNGKPTEVDKVIEVNSLFANELVAAGKAEVTNPPAAPEKPKAPESKAAEPQKGAK